MSTYDITIAGVGGSAPGDGFIDPKNVYVYSNASSEDQPTTYASSLAKSRGNRRHKNIVNAIQFYSGMQIVSVSAGGSPNANTAPSNLVYRVTIGDINSIVVDDENNAGAKLTGIPAIKRIIARPLARTETVMLEVLDPTKAKAPGNDLEVARAGPRFNVETVGPMYGSLAAAEGSVSVALVS